MMLMEPFATSCRFASKSEHALHVKPGAEPEGIGSEKCAHAVQAPGPVMAKALVAEL